MTLAVLAAAAVAVSAGSARTVRLSCVDGDVACDADQACDGGCLFALCPVPCALARCRLPAYRPCDASPSALRIEVPLAREGRRTGRWAGRVGRDRVRLRCRPSGRGCEPPAAQCRRDLPEAQCLASGGDFGARGLAPGPSCLCPAPDAGRSCTRAGDCRGLCLADPGDSAAGRCSEHVTEFGCFTLLDGDGMRRALCID